MAVETWKLIASLLTPIIVLILGLRLSKRLEKNKIGVLKEKEWQVRWAELFLNQAIEFNKNVSIIVCSLFSLQSIVSKSEEEKEIAKKITESVYKLQDIEWEVQNFSQFAPVNNELLNKKQKELFTKLSDFLKNKKGDIEEIRKLQFEYNQIVRKVHSEILNSVL